MRILHDYQIVIRQKFGGISRYHFELIRNMKKLDNNLVVDCPAIFSRNYYFQRFYQKRAYNYNYYYPSLILNDVWTFVWLLAAYTQRKPYDVIHLTWYKPFFIKPFLFLCRKHKPRIIVTVHDLIHEMVAQTNPVMKRGANDRKKMLLIADRIIAISENTKKDLLKFYPNIDQSKISVIYHGFPQKKVQKQSEISLPPNYLLFVGDRKTYKNFNTFIQAVEILSKEDPSLNVVCAGGGCFTQEERLFLKESGMEQKVTQQHMTDDELSDCYKNARCLVYPSLYEGFGMPILEAFSYGCPVVLSNTSCFPEIAQNAAVYFDGKSAMDIAEKIRSLLKSNEKCEQLREAGYQRLKEFSWEKTAQDTLKVYGYKEKQML